MPRTSIDAAPFTHCPGEEDLPSIPESHAGVVPWQVYFGVRNALLARLRPFGTVGPMSDSPIYPGEQRIDDGWAVEVASPEYLVVDDQVSDSHLHHHVEVQSSARISRAVLAALWSHLEQFPQWSVGIAVPKLRYFFLTESGVWFLSPGAPSISSLAEALSLPVVPT